MPKPLRVLIVEDSEDDMFFALQELKRGDYQPEFERVETLGNLSTALDRQVWDLILSDHSLPGFTSLHALELLKNRQYDIPFIILSGVIGEEVAVQAMKAGANDYVMKNALGRLVPSIDRELREASSRRVRRQAEKALRRSQYDLNDFFENAPIAMHWAGPDGTILRVNWAGLALLGYGQHEYLGHSISEFFIDKEAAGEILQKLQSGKSLLDYEAQFRAANGDVKDVRINANGLFEEGKFIRSRWFLSDVTDRKQFEKTSAYLGAIVESSDDAVIGTDLEGVIQSWNSGAARMYGYSAAEAKGKSMRILVPEASPENPGELIQQMLDGKLVDHHESIRIRQDGRTLPVSITLSPIKDSQQNIIGISAIERDITERRQEEEERLYLIDELSRALANVKTLRGLLPICGTCKRVRDDHGYWNKLESYIADHTMAEISHGICPECQAQFESHQNELAAK
jgi:phosphoserine phosphatase RsbU/P